MLSNEYNVQRKHMTLLLRRRVEGYVDLFKHAPKQGTDDWLKSKVRTIGGSEIATVMGKNKYSSVQQLVAQKVGFTHFPGSVKTQWGNLFENVIQIIVEWDIDTKILGDQISIPGIVPNQSYSPDGIGVVETEIKLSWLELNEENKKDHLGREGTTAYYQKDKIVVEPSIVLFEFKCPFNRLPNGKIPEYYEPQVKCGLDTIRDNFGNLTETPKEADPSLAISLKDLGVVPHADKTLCDYGLYIEAQFRKCSWPQLGANSMYDREIWNHDLLTKRIPLSYGFIGFYMNPGLWPLFKYFDSAVKERMENGAVVASEEDREKLTSIVIEQIYLDLLDNNKNMGEIVRYELIDYIPGKNINIEGLTKVINNYQEFAQMMHNNYLDILGSSRVCELAALPTGSVDKLREFSDFGELDIDNMEILFKSFKSGIIKEWYTSPSYTVLPQYRSLETSVHPTLTPEEETRDRVPEEVQRFLDHCALCNYNIAGVFPWKLIRLDYHRIEKEIGFVEKWKDKIAETIQIINEINSTDDQRKKLQRYASVFGSDI